MPGEVFHRMASGISTVLVLTFHLTSTDILSVQNVRNNATKSLGDLTSTVRGQVD